MIGTTVPVVYEVTPIAGSVDPHSSTFTAIVNCFNGSKFAVTDISLATVTVVSALLGSATSPVHPVN
ncbi:hypothetical protein ES708_04634 [subsurface metagenome]